MNLLQITLTVLFIVVMLESLVLMNMYIIRSWREYLQAKSREAKKEEGTDAT